jgi:hypothetical protein
VGQVEQWFTDPEQLSYLQATELCSDTAIKSVINIFLVPEEEVDKKLLEKATCIAGDNILRRYRTDYLKLEKPASATKVDVMTTEIVEWLKTYGISVTVTEDKGKIGRSTIEERKNKEAISKNEEAILRLGRRVIYELAGLEFDKEIEFVPLDDRRIELRDPQEPEPKKGKVVSRIVVDLYSEEAYSVDCVYLGKGQWRTFDEVIKEELHRAKGNARKGLE